MEYKICPTCRGTGRIRIPIARDWADMCKVPDPSAPLSPIDHEPRYIFDDCPTCAGLGEVYRT